VRRGVHEAIGGFDESFLGLGEDFDYCWRVQLETGESLFAVPEAVVHYRLRVGLGPAFRQARNYGAANVSVYAKWRDDLSVPASQWKAGFWAWVHVLADLRRARTRGRFGRWVWELGLLVGYAEASWRRGVLLLCPSPELARPPHRLMRD
jgi:GT2 family glycosyltransferase